MPGLLARLRRGTSDFLRLTRFFQSQADPWERLAIRVAAPAFGLASKRQFLDYLDGPSRVSIASLEDLCDWLRECEALDDQTLFFQADFWQHPVTFEHLRKGDCEDHALWAWRQLHRLGFPALFMAGLWEDTAHAWVTFQDGDVPVLLESTAKTGPLLHPLPSVRDRYCPALAVDVNGGTYVYQGYPRFLDAARPTRPPR